MRRPSKRHWWSRSGPHGCESRKFTQYFVAANLTRTVCNAHPNARRFRKSGSHTSCSFGRFAVGGDCVLRCPFRPAVLGFISEVVGARCFSDLSRVSNFSIPHYFPLEKVHIEDLIRAALWCDIISHSFNSSRAASAWPTCTSCDQLRARLRVACTRMPCARRALEGSLAFSWFFNFMFSLMLLICFACVYLFSVL